MKRFVSFSLAVLAILFISLATERTASAFSGYIDPGSGLLALQCISSVVVATAYYLRRRIVALFTPKKDKKPLVSRVSSTIGTPRNPA
jgi:hypothetical protein